jgi:hypothetical protein
MPLRDFVIRESKKLHLKNKIIETNHSKIKELNYL